MHLDFFFFHSLFVSASLISLSRHGGAEWQKQPPDYPWHCAAGSASRPKANEEQGGRRGGFKKSALIVFLYQEAALARDEDSVLWTSCSSDGSWVYFCGPPSLPSIPPSLLPPILCHPSRLLPIQDVSHFPWLDSYITNAQKNLASSCGQNTTFHLNYLIDFLTVYCFFFFFFPSSFSFFFFFPGSLSAG